jgi:transposase
MQYQQFIGIDVSKLTVDVFIHGSGLHKKFSNDQGGFRDLLKWSRQSVKIDSQVSLICFEHTGLYSLPLSVFLDQHDLPFSMVPALQIKRSMGIARGKSDKVDARRIAQYAYLHRETLTPTRLPSKAILKLHPLFTLRDRLVRQCAAYRATRKEQLKFLPDGQFPELFATYDKLIITLKQEFKSVESAIKKIINDEPELAKTFQLITGIKGVGFIVATGLIVYTHNFTRFQDWRKFACYAGVAPFQNQSGTSVRGKNKVSHIANKQIKKLLHMAAMHASHHDKEMMAYFVKRVNDGKSKMATLNIIRNKVLARVFAVAKRQTEYVDVMRHVA